VVICILIANCVLENKVSYAKASVIDMFVSEKWERGEGNACSLRKGKDKENLQAPLSLQKLHCTLKDLNNFQIYVRIFPVLSNSMSVK